MSDTGRQRHDNKPVDDAFIAPPTATCGRCSTGILSDRAPFEGKDYHPECLFELGRSSIYKESKDTNGQYLWQPGNSTAPSVSYATTGRAPVFASTGTPVVLASSDVYPSFTISATSSASAPADDPGTLAEPTGGFIQAFKNLDRRFKEASRRKEAI
jgi:hypothetical protein